jgi:hypothetical protein
LQEAAEAFVVHLFEDTNMGHVICAIIVAAQSSF